MKKVKANVPKARPFLKWAGGKTKLLPELRKRVPASYGTYYEPFLGGGSLFFDLAPTRARLSDVNSELTCAYHMVRDQVEDLIRILHNLELDYRKHKSEFYYKMRAIPPITLKPIERAARMIFLNKTCFNGLYRVNKLGKFNTPEGKFKTFPLICDENNLRLCSGALGAADIVCDDFRDALLSPQSGDFVYLDPPYVPVSDTASFVGYAKGGFGPKDQKDLVEEAKRLKDRGILVCLSNSGTEKVAELYKDFEIKTVEMRRNINSRADKRENVNEYLIW